MSDAEEFQQKYVWIVAGIIGFSVVLTGLVGLFVVTL
ncbi:hypothetical protein MnTg02_03369 [bacterium MnTg02]|nr:hypothetical protein MnTg02_03369 [bacterium MnTg02]